MRIIIHRKALAAAIASVKGASDAKSAVPALGNILLDATAGSGAALSTGKLRVAATDLYRSASVSVDCEVIESGSVALPAEDLEKRVRAMNEGPLELSVDSTFRATLRQVGKARRFDIAGIPGSEFPLLASPTADAQAFIMPASMLAELIARTHFAVSSDVVRPHINSALVEVSTDAVRMVSTDGHRLSKAEASRSGEGACSFLIPLAALVEIRKLLDGVDGDVIVTPGAMNFIDVAGLRFGFKNIEAQFPPYSQVIPRGGVAARCNVALLVDALRAVSLASSDKVGGVKIGFEPGKLKIHAESAEAGAGFDEVPLSYDGDAFVVGVNAGYVIAALGAVDTDDAELMVTASELDPIAIRPIGGVGYIGVVMPMRI